MNSDDESCVQQDEEVDQILDLAVDYAVRRSFPPGITKEKSREKKSVNPRSWQGRSVFEEEGATSEGGDRHWRAAMNPRVMPFWSYVRTLRYDENLEESCRAVLLARNVETSEGVGK